MDKLVTCLWFDTEGEDAARFYTSIFPGSELGEITRYGSAGPRAEGTVMTVGFELMGQEFVALNGGPNYTFNQAISFQILCDSQEEVDRYWEQLTDGGEEGPCGWLTDRFGCRGRSFRRCSPACCSSRTPRSLSASWRR